MNDANAAGESEITTGGPATTGDGKSLRDAALAKRRHAAGPPKPSAAAPAAKPAPSAQALADDDARERKLKLPSKAASASATDDEPPAAPIGEGAETIQIGEHRIPVDLLAQLSDEHLRLIKRKIKAGGKELDITLADALSEYPKGVDYMNKTRKLADARKQLEGIARKMGTDPVAAYAQLHGVSLDVAADRISQQLLRLYDREQMTPAERQEHDRRAQLEERAARADELEDAERERERTTQAGRKREQYLTAMRPALEAAGLALTDYAIKRVADRMGALMDAGVIEGDPTPEDLADAAREVAKERQADLDGELPEDGEKLIARLGEKRAKLIAQAWGKRVARRAEAPTREPGAKPRTPAAPANETWKQWQERIRREAIVRDRARGIR